MVKKLIDCSNCPCLDDFATKCNLKYNCEERILKNTPFTNIRTISDNCQLEEIKFIQDNKAQIFYPVELCC